jgi:hypothetical protein
MIGDCINESAPWLLGIGGFLGVILGISIRYIQKRK